MSVCDDGMPFSSTFLSDTSKFIIKYYSKEAVKQYHATMILIQMCTLLTIGRE